MNFTNRVKLELVHSIRKFDEAIIVAGLGRCGTTLFHNSLIHNHFYKGDKEIIQLQNHLNSFQNGIVYKTHDYPPKSLPDNVKLVFMFGNPMDTVISTHRIINQWGLKHHHHLSSDLFNPNDEIFYKDTLRLQQLFNAWDQTQNFEFVSVRYEALYNKSTIDTLSDYLGFKLKLNPKLKRKTNWMDHPLKGELMEVYGKLYDEINSIEDVKICLNER